MSGCAGRSWCENYTQSAHPPRRSVSLGTWTCVGTGSSSAHRHLRPAPGRLPRTRCPRPRHPLNLPPAEICGGEDTSGEQRLRAGCRAVVREPRRRRVVPRAVGRRGLGADRDRVSRRRHRGDRPRGLARDGSRAHRRSPKAGPNPRKRTTKKRTTKTRMRTRTTTMMTMTTTTMRTTTTTRMKRRKTATSTSP